MRAPGKEFHRYSFTSLLFLWLTSDAWADEKHLIAAMVLLWRSRVAKRKNVQLRSPKIMKDRLTNWCVSLVFFFMVGFSSIVRLEDYYSIALAWAGSHS